MVTNAYGGSCSREYLVILWIFPLLIHLYYITYLD